MNTTQSMTDSSLMPFGKYQGKRLIDVPAQYLLWLYNEGCSHTALKQYLNDNLQALNLEAGNTKKYGRS